jgi:hypothetical protein
MGGGPFHYYRFEMVVPEDKAMLIVSRLSRVCTGVVSKYV